MRNPLAAALLQRVTFGAAVDTTDFKSTHLDFLVCGVIAEAIRNAQAEGGAAKAAAIEAADAFRAGVESWTGSTNLSRADMYRRFKKAGL
jgi:hypothetical protein